MAEETWERRAALPGFLGELFHFLASRKTLHMYFCSVTWFESDRRRFGSDIPPPKIKVKKVGGLVWFWRGRLLAPNFELASSHARVTSVKAQYH